MGLVLLLMRLKVREPEIYSAAMKADVQEDTVARGDFFAVFTSLNRFLRYMKCLLISLPVFYAIGIIL